MLVLIAALPLLCAAAGRDSTRARPGLPTLFAPARPDTVPPESEPAPLLIPGRGSPGDTATRSANERAVEQYRLGRQFEDQGRLGPALAAYNNAIRYDPKLPDAYYRMGRIFLSAGSLREAVQCFAAEVTHHPERTDAARELGLGLARTGDTARAIAQLELLVKRAPRDGASWHALGFAYSAANRPADALRALRRAIALPPASPEEHRDLGAALAALGRVSEARAEYARALKLGPRDPSSWFNLGNLERRAGQTDSALADYHRAEAGDSTFVPALRGQIELLRERGRGAEAAGVYRRWLARDPAQHGARFETVQLLDALELEREALAVAREGVERLPEAGQTHLIYGVALSSRRQREALAELRRAETLFAEDAREQARTRALIAQLRRSAPDSLRGWFLADSLAHPDATPAPHAAPRPKTPR